MCPPSGLLTHPQWLWAPAFLNFLLPSLAPAGGSHLSQSPAVLFPPPARPESARAPALLPGLVSAPGAPRAGCQVTCVSDNLLQGGPPESPRSRLVGLGLARLGAGPGSRSAVPRAAQQQKDPDGLAAARKATGAQEPGPPQLPQRPPLRSAHVSAGDTAGGRRLGARSSPSLPGPLPSAAHTATPRTCG